MSDRNNRGDKPPPVLVKKDQGELDDISPVTIECKEEDKENAIFVTPPFRKQLHKKPNISNRPWDPLSSGRDFEQMIIVRRKQFLKKVDVIADMEYEMEIARFGKDAKAAIRKARMKERANIRVKLDLKMKNKYNDSSSPTKK